MSAPAAAAIPTRQATDCRRLYSNAVSVTKGQYDLCFRFGVVLDWAPGKPIVEEQVHVYVTEAHAHALFGLLQQVLIGPEAGVPGTP